MPRLNINQLAIIVNGTLHGRGEGFIEQLETDSRNIQPGSAALFVAIRGDRHDGHDYLDDLLEGGLRYFLIEEVSPRLKTHPDASYILVENTLQALQQLASHIRTQLRMPVIAITGSNGKTVVKEWLATCLSQKGQVSRSPKSYNSQVGVPLSVWLLQADADWSILEAGISLPGEMEKLEKIIAPDLGIFTNIGPAHQENFASLEQKVIEKLKLFRHAKVLYCCLDHRYIHQEVSRQQLGCQMVTWSKESRNCYLYVREIKTKGNSTLLSISYDHKDEVFSLPFTDEASLENCLHILCFLLHQGFQSAEVQAGFDALVPVAMRLEQIDGQGNCTLINDSYNSDLHSLRIALDYLSTQKQHKKHSLILSDIRQSGTDINKLYAEVFNLTRRYALHQLIVVGPDIKNSGRMPDEARWFPTTGELLMNLRTIDLREQTLLIKGARDFGFEQIVSALAKKKHSTVLEINLEHLVHNLNYFRGLLQPETRIMVMVKALSYGSGSFEIANLLQHQKVDYLGVAYTDEGVELRRAGVSLPIMVMAPTEGSFAELIEYKLEPEIFSLEGLNSFVRLLSSGQSDQYPVHLKIDTGMHRLGFMPEEIGKLIRQLAATPAVRVKGIFSHLAVSDNPEEDEFTRNQIRLFREISDELTTALGYQPIRYILNSAGIERFPEAHLDMVRLGIGLHGISAVNGLLKPVSTLKTIISQIKKVPKTDTVGYNRHGILDRDSEIAILPVGYADGLNRKLGNRNGQVWYKDTLVPFIGDICMDLCMIDVTGLDAGIGDEVIIFGEQHTISQLALQVGTIPYEILTGISTRVKRIYLNT
ncbi:MAG: bifunctional UDP-N-acetylmuramoyl-tripeptide:D-alanyl-D-alanine ligase/alanine racemase [Bacteroidales bacterium]|nr:bifunctional UDP-N-acetylmuramoyl-tripeptide:D-alanyl-D-alanine ligase/alanine racemase [Bacteroidales bacterium]